MYGESAVKVKVSLGVRLKLGLNTFINFRHTVSSAGCPENVDHFFYFSKTKSPFKILLIIIPNYYDFKYIFVQIFGLLCNYF